MLILNIYLRLFKNIKNIYVYFRFVKIGKNTTHRSDCTKIYFKALDQTSVFDNEKHFKIVAVSNDSFSTYEQYVKRGKVNFYLIFHINSIFQII